MSYYTVLFRVRLKMLMEQSGWGPAELARRVGMMPTAISRHLKGDHVPGLDVVERFAGAFNLTLSEFMNEKGPPPRQAEVAPSEALAVLSQALSRLDQLETRNRELEALYGKPTRSADEIMAEMEAEMGIGEKKEPGKKRG